MIANEPWQTLIDLEKGKCTEFEGNFGQMYGNSPAFAFSIYVNRNCNSANSPLLFGKIVTSCSTK